MIEEIFDKLLSATFRNTVWAQMPLLLRPAQLKGLVFRKLASEGIQKLMIFPLSSEFINCIRNQDITRYSVCQFISNCKTLAYPKLNRWTFLNLQFSHYNELFGDLVTNSLLWAGQYIYPLGPLYNLSPPPGTFVYTLPAQKVQPSRPLVWVHSFLLTPKSELILWNLAVDPASRALPSPLPSWVCTPVKHLILHLCPFRINSHSYCTFLVTEHAHTYCLI